MFYWSASIHIVDVGLVVELEGKRKILMCWSWRIVVVMHPGCSVVRIKGFVSHDVHYRARCCTTVGRKHSQDKIWLNSCSLTRPLICVSIKLEVWLAQKGLIARHSHCEANLARMSFTGKNVFSDKVRRIFGLYQIFSIAHTDIKTPDLLPSCPSVRTRQLITFFFSLYFQHWLCTCPKWRTPTPALQQKISTFQHKSKKNR